MNENGSGIQVRLGVIGMSKRGKSLIRGCYAGMPDVVIKAVCDIYEDRVREAVELVKQLCGHEAAGYTDYRDLLARDDIDAVVIATSWNTHSDILVAAMRAGKVPASEVGGAYSLEECWQLVRTSEETGIRCMMLSNANYGRKEMAVLNMVKQGLFGEIIHCQAGYQHDLRDEVAEGAERRHYRLDNYLHRDGDIYPIHGIGPIAKILDINRGNRFVALSSMSSKARGLKQWAAVHLGADHPVAHAAVAMGDVVTTMIKCSRGETILLVHDTTLPRPYSKCRRVQGTKGLWLEDSTSIHIEGRSEPHQWEAFEDYMREFDHPLWKQYLVDGIRGGHNGVDYLVARAFIESVKAKQSPPVDVYDMAAWMAITALSEQSVALGGQTVAFPDFTNGKWINRRAAAPGKYSLDSINAEPETASPREAAKA